MPSCRECKTVFPSIKALVFHLNLAHTVNITNEYVCGESLCLAKFSTVRDFNKHLRNIHKFSNDVTKQKKEEPLTKEQHNETNEECSVDTGSDETPEVSNDSQNDISVEDFKNFVDLQADAFVAKLYTYPWMPRSHAQTIINDTDSLLSSGFFDIVKEKTLQSLKSCNADISVIQDIQAMYDVIEHPFKKVRSDYCRLKRLKLSGDYVEPQNFPLGKELKVVQTCDGRKAKWVDVNAKSVPLRKTLKQFLQLPHCLDSIFSYLESLRNETDTISNFVQGDLWKEIIAKYDSSKTVIPLFIFFDDFEGNNALGSHAGKLGKLGAVYASIPCLPPECQSALENIFLALLFNSQDRIEFKNKKVLRPLLDELRFLEETGIEVETDGVKKRVYIPLGLVIGDNLGLHQLCGLVESFSATYFCRFCKVTKRQSENTVTANGSLLRTAESYATDLELNDVSLTGINSECEFNELLSFHIMRNTTVDYMHDVAEGVIPYTLAFLVSKYIGLYKKSSVRKEKIYFTLEDLNYRIKNFDYGPHVSNKPPIISEESLLKGHLKMSASEAVCFVRYFGVLVGDKVPENDSHWELYIALMRVLEVILSKTVPRSVGVTFPVLVEEFLRLYVSFGNNLKPKFHHLLHYATVFLRCGPVSHLSCFRFESKHRPLKQYVVTNNSRVNLPHSVSVKHQLSACTRYKAGKEVTSEMQVGPVEKLVLSSHDFYFSFRNSLPSTFTQHSEVDITCSLHFKGTTYSSSMVLVAGSDKILCWPTFGKIEFVIINNDNPIFVCTRLATVQFSEHYFAYEVQRANDMFCVSFSDLLDPLPVFNSSSNHEVPVQYVVMRYLV